MLRKLHLFSEMPRKNAKFEFNSHTVRIPLNSLGKTDDGKINVVNFI